MNCISKITAIVICFIVFEGLLPAGDFEKRVETDPGIAAGIYHPYHHRDLTDTKAPKGYKPFYISHFGRHGSRYHTSMDFFTKGMEGLEAANHAGILTEAGKSLLEDVTKVKEAHEGMSGELTPLGGREHKDVAERMYRRFRPVFESPSRKEVECVASTITRCIISMANFTESLDDQNPDLDFSFYTGKKYFSYIMKAQKEKSISAGRQAMEDSLRNAICKYDKLFAELFTDKEKALQLVPDPQSFARSVYMAGAIAPDLDFLNVDIFKYFDSEELTQQYIVSQNGMYAGMGNSYEWGDKSICSADDVLEDFITKADAALKADSHRAADLRFGHDSGLLPLTGLIGIKEMCVQYKVAEAHKYWTCYDNIPMCSNFQMIFYRNKAGDVLVKMLYNEQETTIPALQAYSGPYYKWQALRAYLATRVEMGHKYNARFEN